MIHDGDSYDLDKARNKSVTIAVGPSPLIVSALPACAVYDLNGDLIVDLADINWSCSTRSSLAPPITPTTISSVTALSTSPTSSK